MRSIRFVGVVILGIAAGSWCHAAAAQSVDAKLAPGVKKLLQVGWQRSRVSREEAAEQYKRLQEMAPDDRRIKYAYALVQLRQMKYREASVLLGEVLDGGHEAIVAREAQLWLMMMLKQYDRAMIEIPKLAKRLPKTELEGDAEKPYTEVANFLGRACGYLIYPAKGQVSAPVLSQCQDAVLAQLTPQRRIAFEEGRSSVMKEFTNATEQSQADSAKAEAEAAEQKEQKLTELEEQSRVAAAALVNEQQRADSLKKDLQYEISDLAEEQTKVAVNMRQLEIAVVQLRQELSILDNRIRQLLQRAENEQDPLKKQPFLDAAARWQLNRNQAFAVLADRERQYAFLNQQRAALMQRRAVAEQRLQQAGGRVAQFEKNVQKVHAERTRTTGQSVSGQTAGVRHQKRRSTALTTYVPMPFSLEAEAKRVLGWFK